MKPRGLYKHQQAIINDDPKKCGLFLGTGSGKTRIALLLAKGDILVICPKTQKEDQNWEREYKQLVLETVDRYTNGKTPPTFKPRLTVMSKEEFRRDAHALEHFNTVIVDEAHTCLGVTPTIRWRNKKPIPLTSQLYEALEAYIKRTKPERLYLCTATIMKSPMTVWAASQILGKPIDFYEFRATYYTKLPIPGRDVYTPVRSPETKDSLGELVKSLGYIGRLDQFFDVPKQTFMTRYIELTKEQKDVIKDLHLDYPDPLVRIGKRHQVENGVLAGDEFSKAQIFDNNKIEALLDLAMQFPRMVVFVKYKAQINQIQNELSKAGYHTWTLTGDTNLLRGEIIKDANERDGIFIVQAQISAGWETPNTPVMVFASRTYSWVDYEQSLGRIQRANAIKKNIYINLVTKGGIDEAVDKSLANKADFNERMYINL